MDAEDDGRGTSLRPGLFKLATDGTGGVGRPGIAGAPPKGGLGAPKVGGFGAEPAEDSGSDRYEESRLAIERISMLPCLKCRYCPSTCLRIRALTSRINATSAFS